MKKISYIVNIIIVIVLLLLLAILFGPMLFPSTAIGLANSITDTDNQYVGGTVISLKSTDKTVMDDIYMQNTYTVDNSMSEIHQNLNLSMGKEDFRWIKYFKFDNLQEKSPFDGRSLEFKDIKDYNISKPDTEKKPFFYDFSTESIKNMEIYEKNYSLDPYVQDDFFGKLRINYTYVAKDATATDIFKKFLEEFKGLNAYSSFFTENKLIETSLLMEDNVSGLDKILELISDNSEVKELKIQYSVSLNKIEKIQMFVNFDYTTKGKPINMEFYASQGMEDIKDVDISSITYFSSLIDIDTLSPDTATTDKYGEYSETDTTVPNPVDGNGEIPGVILNEEYEAVVKGG